MVCGFAKWSNTNHGTAKNQCQGIEPESCRGACIQLPTEEYYGFIWDVKITELVSATMH